MKYQTYYAKTYEMPNSLGSSLSSSAEDQWRGWTDEGQKTTYISDQCVYAALAYVNGSQPRLQVTIMLSESETWGGVTDD